MRKTVKSMSKLWQILVSLIHCCSSAKCHLEQTSYIKWIKFLLVCHIINILLTKTSQSEWENLDLGLVYRPHCILSTLMPLLKILPYGPPAWVIRATCKYKVLEPSLFPEFSVQQQQQQQLY